MACVRILWSKHVSKYSAVSQVGKRIQKKQKKVLYESVHILTLGKIKNFKSKELCQNYFNADYLVGLEY